MVNILLSGANGKMGHVIADIVAKRDDCSIAAGIDLNTQEYGGFPIYDSIGLCGQAADVIIDFSHPSALPALLRFSKSNKTPVVFASTGYTTEQIEQIKAASNEIPVFFSFNMSLGINLLVELAKKAVQILGDGFDIEIIEKHHNQKVDAPSGTAIMIADAINQASGNQYEYKYDRHSERQKRDKKELGMHAVRGGTIVGEHEILFAGRDEIITLSHSARSKEVFAVGSVNAAMFLYKQPAGLYDMSKLI